MTLIQVFLALLASMSQIPCRFPASWAKSLGLDGLEVEVGLKSGLAPLVPGPIQKDQASKGAWRGQRCRADFCSTKHHPKAMGCYSSPIRDRVTSLWVLRVTLQTRQPLRDDYDLS